MSTLDPRKTLSNLLSKGFQKDNRDHQFLGFFIKDKLVLHTKISHNSGDIDNYLIKRMASQCKLTKSQFIDLAQCPLSEKEYLEILEKQGYLN
jgi:hypothetical protein